MVTDSFISLACGGLIVSIFGALMCLFGYRLFLILLPIWGFVFGFGLGAQTMQAIFGTGFLSEVTSWVVGFFVGLFFALLAYLFYIAAVAIIAGSIGYMIAVGLLLAIGLNMGFLVWLIGLIAGVALAFVTIRFNIQKWVIIIATSLAGAAVVFGGYFAMFNPFAQLMQNPIRAFLSASPLLMIMAIVLAIVGIVFQYRDTKSFTLASYDRWEEVGYSG
jgi:hypothetical protein